MRGKNMSSKFSHTLFTFLFLLIFFVGCQEDEYEIKYSVISGIDSLPAKILFKGAMKTEQFLTDEILPWSYNFIGEKGDSIKVAANVFDNGTIRMIGTDTLKVLVFINGIKYKDNLGLIIKSSSDVITVSGIIQ